MTALNFHESERTVMPSWFPAPVLFHNGLHHGTLEVTIQLPIGIISLNHQKAHDLLFGIHPKVGSIGAVPPETAG